MNSESPPRRSGVLPIYLVITVALAAALGLQLGQRYFSAPPTPVLQSTLLYPAPRALPEFSLDTAGGDPLTAETLMGRWTLVFIGFTHCPDICPTTLGLLARALSHWRTLPTEQQPRILFVSVDPERDDPETAAKYAAFFSPDIAAATADHSRLSEFTRSLGMVYMKTPLEGDNYTVDHSASVAVLNPEVELVGSMRPPLEPGKISADLRALMDAAQ